MPGKECGIKTKQEQNQQNRDDHRVPDGITSSKPVRCTINGLFHAGSGFIPRRKREV